MSTYSGLAEDLLAWVGDLTGGEVVNHRRHEARREAWEIDVHAQAGEQKYFLRIDRPLADGRVSTRNLRRETALIRALNSQGVPTQSIIGWNDRHCAALQSWLPGSGRLDREPRELQHKIMMEFMGILADLHRIDIDRLQLPEFVRPTTTLEHSLLEIEAVEEPALFPESACATNPLAAFGKRWLINHAPPEVEATVLVQGDTGPGNFMSDDRAVTAIMDWEWAHYGDPMEDLGNVWLRDFFTSCCDGDLRPYFDHYARCSGFTLNRDSIAYYRVHQLVRSVISLDYLTEHLDWQTPVPLNLGYRAVVDIETCAAMAELSGQERRHTEPLPRPPMRESIHGTLAQQIEQMALPQLDDPFTEKLARGHADVMRHLELKARYQAEFDDIELVGLRNLLGTNAKDLDSGRAQLLQRISALTASEEAPVLDHLYTRSVNQARLMAPLTTLWQQCRWAKI